MSADSLQLSVVVPVYNGADTIGLVVNEILALRNSVSLEIILVDDGSTDSTASVCRLIALQNAGVRFFQLARNYGEHAAVLAGLGQIRGEVAAIVDDDGQQNPNDIVCMAQLLLQNQVDVVYGIYRRKHHPPHRRLASWISGQTARLLIGKPSQLYLSSFKVMNRFLVQRITEYRGPYPYIDGLIMQCTNRIAQIEVQHRPRVAGNSGYTLARLLRLWLNMAAGFSVLPLRLSLWTGIAASGLSLLLLLEIVFEKLWLRPDLPQGIPAIIAALSLFSGLQFVLLGIVGEYLGRTFLTVSGARQYVIRSQSDEIDSLPENSQIASQLCDTSLEACA